MADDPARKALNAIVDALQDLQSADRKRAVLGALHFLEEDWVPLPQTKGGAAPSDDGSKNTEGSDDTAVSPVAKQWMKKNDLSGDAIEQVFSFDNGKVSILADIPGKGKRDKTIAIYTLMGLGTYLQTGERTFSDEPARAACETHSAYDQSNHAATMREMTSELTGDKKVGWTITMPGLKKAAALVKEITAGSK